MINNYYIYFHINPLRNEIFYIGKGKNNRAYNKNNRNKQWYNIVNKYGFIIDICEENLTEEQAFEREIFYINKIGRRDLNKGTLVNMTNGGEGYSQYETEEERLNTHIQNKKNFYYINPNYQKNWNKNNSEKRKEYTRNWYKNNKDYWKEYRKNNREKYNETSKKSRIKNKKK